MTVTTVLTPRGPQIPLRAARGPSGTPGSPSRPGALTTQLWPAAGPSRPALEVTAADIRESRDRTVLHLTARGLTHERIARLFDIRTVLIVESASRLRVKYGAANAAQVVGRALAAGDLARGPGGQAPVIRDRHRAVLALVAAGLANSAIARRLLVSTPVIGQDMNQLMGRFGVDCRAQLVAVAFRTGVLVADAGGRDLVLAGGAP